MRILLAILILISGAAFAIEQEQVNEDFIAVQLTETGKKLRAKITSLGSAGKEAGFDEVSLVGSVSKESDASGEKVKVTWAAVELNEDASAIAEPFTSVLIVQDDLNSGMEFKAKGNKQALLDALQALSERAGEKRLLEDKEEDEETKSAAHSSLSGGEGQENPTIDTASPEFVPEEEPFIFITSDGCEMLTDEAQGVAIVQERTLVNGEEQSACSESLTRYPLTRVYADCPLLEDVQNLTVFEQFTLGYVDPKSAGRIEVRGCTQDPDRTISMITDTTSCSPLISGDEALVQARVFYYKDGIEHTVSSCTPVDNESFAIFTVKADCSIRHDFDEEISYQQVKKAYNNGTEDVIVPSSVCEDDPNQTYAHITTRETCQATVADDEVVFNFRKFINVGGEISYITECAPDLSQNTPVLSENCTTSPYDHDFETGQSYRKKNYYYMDGDKRVNVLNCVASEETFTHFKDTGVCQTTNDDTTRLSQYYAKTFLTDDNEPTGNRTFITDCQQFGEPIDYTPAGEIWQAKFNTIKAIKTQGGGFTVNDNSGNWAAYHYAGNGQRSDLSMKYGWSNKPYNFECRGSEICAMTTGGVPPQFTTNGKYCVTGNLQVSNWITIDNITIDKENSDTAPTWGWEYSTVSGLNSNCKDSTGLASWAVPSASYHCTTSDMANIGALNCTTPTCTITTLQKHPVYTRGDGTEYIHTSQVTGTKYVCGDGNKLDNKKD